MTLQGLCDEYRALLGLAEWALTCRLAGPGEIREGNVGQLDWSRSKSGDVMTGLVLLEPSDRHDHEVTIVHELCHIPLIPCPPRGLEERLAQEQAVERFASALVQASRVRRTTEYLPTGHAEASVREAAPIAAAAKKSPAKPAVKPAVKRRPKGPPETMPRDPRFDELDRRIAQQTPDQD